MKVKWIKVEPGSIVQNAAAEGPVDQRIAVAGTEEECGPIAVAAAGIGVECGILAAEAADVRQGPV